MHRAVASPSTPPGGAIDVDAAVAAVLDDVTSREAVGLVAVLEDGRPTALGARGLPDAGVAERLLAGAGADRVDELDVDGRPWRRVSVATGDGTAVVVAVPGEAMPDAVAVAAHRLARDVLVARERATGERLGQLLATAGRVVATLDLEEVLTAIVRDATQLLRAMSGDMLLLDPDGQRLRVVAVWNFPPGMVGFELRRGEGVSWLAMERRGPFLVDDYRHSVHRARGLDAYDFGAVLCVPLLFRDEAIGAINVHAGVPGSPFPASDVELLTAFAGHAAIAIDHARRFANEVRLGRDLAETNRALSRTLAVQQRLAEQVILDGGPTGIASVLAEDLGRHVAIEDHLHRRIASAPPGGDAVGGDGEPFSVAVRVGREVVGHLLLSAEGELGPIDRALVDSATTGVALEFAKARAALEVEERLRGEAVADLLAGTFASDEAIAARAARLGHDLGQPRDLLVVDPGPIADDDGPAGASADRLRDRLAVVRDRLAHRPGSLAVAHGGAIVALVTPARVPAAGSTTRTPMGAESADADARAAALELRAALARGADDERPAVTIAIGGRCTRPSDYAEALRAGREALDLMLRLGRRGATIGARELGPYALLLRASSREDLEAFARRTLGILLEPERGHGADLLHTLRVHLEEGRVQRRTAARCFIHVNTVVYRLRRIEELLAVSLDDPDAVFDLTLALRILDLLGPGAGEGSAGA